MKTAKAKLKSSRAVKPLGISHQSRGGFRRNTVGTPIKLALRAKGWSYRRAAQELGISYQYLCTVANGHRTSLRLEKRVAALPPAPTSFAE